MLNFPYWKIITVIFICVASIFIALPNILTGETRDKLTSMLGIDTINLGLDLRGGSYLLLEIDFDSYMKEQYEMLTDDIRSRLRKKKAGYTDLSSNKDSASFMPGNTPEGFDVEGLYNDKIGEVEVDREENNKITITYHEDAIKQMRKDVIGQSIETVRRRVDETGTREPIIQRQGDKRILLQVPGLDSPDQLKKLLGKVAKLSFHLMDEKNPFPTRKRASRPGFMLLTSEKESDRFFMVKKKVELTGDMLVDSRATFDEYNRPAVNFRFNNAGGIKFARITTANNGKPFAIVLDGKVLTAPVIQTPITGGSGIITGSFTTEEANNLSLLLRSGALPAPLIIKEERTVGPSLGADSIDSGKKAAMLGVVLVMVAMIIFYGLFGLFANIALIMNLVLLFAALSLFQATLTLPGIAGIVLTMGMAVDANVIIFERIRDEISIGRTTIAAIDHGFRNAFGTIFDSNLTTLIAALFLYIFGTGPIRGFSVTLSIGILASMFSAIMLTRMMIVLWLKKTKPKSVPI